MSAWLELSNPVTYKDFRSLMAKRRYDTDDLVDLFHGKLDENRAFFERVMAPGHGDRDKLVIPYRSVLKMYFEEKRSEDAKKAGFAP